MRSELRTPGRCHSFLRRRVSPAIEPSTLQTLMKKPARVLVLIVSLPLLAGCFALQPVPVPANPAARESMAIRGVILGATQERVVFSNVLQADWGPDAVSLVGTPSTSPEGVIETRLFPLTSIESVLVHQIDPGKTSAIIGGVMVGVIAFWATWVTGRGDDLRTPG